MGYRTFWLKEGHGAPIKGATAVTTPDGRVRVETDFYQAELDPNQGGTFRSLMAKRLGNRELVDAGAALAALTKSAAISSKTSVFIRARKGRREWRL